MIPIRTLMSMALIGQKTTQRYMAALRKRLAAARELEQLEEPTLASTNSLIRSYRQRVRRSLL
jgi:hypothetical protein